MKFNLSNRWNLWKRLLLFSLLVPLLVVGILTFIIFQKQDGLVQSEIDALNQSYKGLIVIGDTHIAPFKNFPYTSIKIDSVQVYESKEQDAALILEVADIYIGFNLWDIVSANYDVQKLLIEDGFFNIIKHPDGSFNIQNALAPTNKGNANSGAAAPLDIHLKNIELKNLDIHQFDQGNKLDIETLI